jgi:spermidine synthase
MLLSGFAGLGYQMVWTQQFGVWLGHEIVAVLAVVAAFFGGLALGAATLGRRIEASRHPVRWYAACEALIAGWALLLVFLMPVANRWLADRTGVQPSAFWQWGIAFAGPFLLLLPATAAMGATLPAMAAIRTRLRIQGHAIGALYAANTGGAVAGVLVTTFLLIPAVGLERTALLCAACNLACAALAWLLLPALQPHASRARSVGAGTAAGAGADRAGRLAMTLFVTGLLGIGYEVVVVRVLSQITEDTVYSFALMLAVYLLGTAIGAALYQRMQAPLPGARAGGAMRGLALRLRLMCGLSLAMLASLLVLWQADAVQAYCLAHFGRGFGAGLAVEATLAAGAFGLPSMAMGALFSHLCVEAAEDGGRLGNAFGINTLGATCAPLLFGVVLLPWLGPKLLLVLIALGYLALLPARQLRHPAGWGPALAGVLFATSPASLDFVDVPEGGHVLSYRNGVMAAVSVVEDAQGVARLRIDNRQQEGSSASGLADARLAYLPLLLHPAPHAALFLGLGTGVTASAAAEDPALKVDAVELLPEVIQASHHFKQAVAPGTSADVGDVAAGTADGFGKPHVVAADARRYVRASDRQYDVIVADLFHPARSGAGALYTVEHFAAVEARLAPDGLFCQWLPLHQLDIASLKSIVASFLKVYPGALAMIATNSLDTPVLGLIALPGQASNSPFALDRLQSRLAAESGQARRAALHLDDAFAVLGGVIAGPGQLAAFAEGAPLNTDDLPTVAHRAPYLVYSQDSLPRDRLLTLLQTLHPDPQALLGAPASAADARWQERLRAYWAARSRFIEAGMGVRPEPDPRRMLAEVGAPLLEIVRMSGDFRPAYDPLLRMATAVASTDATQARAVLTALQAAQPARPEAGAVLAQMRENAMAFGQAPR